MIGKTFLASEIREAKSNGQISSLKPIIVVEGKPYRFKHELKESRLKLSRDDIEKIEILKEDVGIRLYGDYAEGGVLVVTTKNNFKQKKEESNNQPEQNTLTSLIKNNKIIIFVDGKETKAEEIQNMNPNDIDSVSVLKGEAAKKLFPEMDLDGVIYITMKKH